MGLIAVLACIIYLKHLLMVEFVKSLQKEINRKVEKIDRSDADPIKKALEASHVLGQAFDRLKEFIISYHFKDESEEIEFFKEIKPKIFYRLIYYRKVYNIEMNRPVACIDTQREYLLGELESINKYTGKRLDFIRYFRSGSTHLDNLYFLRGQTDTEQYLESFYYELDPLFSTNCDFKVAKILANDMLTVYLYQELEALQADTGKYFFGFPFPETRLTWQDGKTDLLELIYALDSKHSFGKDVSLTQLANYLSNVFNIQIDANLSRTFCDMKIRNNPTPWLDSLKEALINRMQSWKRKKK